MYWNWQDQTGKISLVVRPRWVGRFSEDHTALLCNGSGKTISELSFDIEKLDRAGRVISSSSSLSFYDVAAGSEHKSDFDISKKFRIKFGTLEFADGSPAQSLDPALVSITRSPWEAFRLTANKILAIEITVVAAIICAPFMKRMDLFPDFSSGDRIESCIQARSNYRPTVSVKDSWVTAEYYYERADAPTNRGLYALSLYADSGNHTSHEDQSGYMVIIKKGKVMRSGKFTHVEIDESHSSLKNSVPTDPEIRDLKACTMQVLPGRVYVP